MASLDDRLLELLRTNRIGRVATIKRDGRPQLSNVIYAWDDDTNTVRVSVTDGFPDLTEGFETSLAGLYLTGFASTRDFGPFYGFTAGCPSAARIAVAEMMR